MIEAKILNALNTYERITDKTAITLFTRHQALFLLLKKDKFPQVADQRCL